MDVQYPNRTIKKTSGFKDTFKYHEERAEKVKKAVFTFIQDNNAEIISGDQIFFDGKNMPFSQFASNVKFILEGKLKTLPILTHEEYISILRILHSEQHRQKQLISTNQFSKNLSKDEILGLIQSEKLDFSKSLEQAEEFLQHVLFRIPDATNNLVKVVAKRFYDVKDLTGQTHKIEKEIMLPGFKTLRDYEETLKHINVRAPINEEQETYWDVYSRSKAVVQASMVYNPHKELYWCDEFKHYYVNSYKEPAWRDEPDFFYLMERHKNDPITFNKLGNLLRSFLIHLFPDNKVRQEVLKWCAFSNTDKLQTYLTLIGPQGIGKNLLVDEFLSYYHGDENLNKPKTIEIKFNDKCAKSTLLFFDELTMVNLEQYNEMKCYINKKLSYEEKNRPIYMGQNFANIVWSCNTKDTMSGMSRDDRRFKIVPITSEKLIGAPVFDENNKKVGVFTSQVVAAFANSELAKKEFVLLMLSIRDHVEATKQTMDDINTISENEARDTIFSESRSIEFIDIIDVLKNIHNDYNEQTQRFGNKPMTQEEKDTLGVVYQDYIPLSKVLIAKENLYTYRVPSAVIRKVMLAKANKQKPMSLRAFNRHLENMPEKYMKGFIVAGQARDVEIKLDYDAHKKFESEYKSILLNYMNRKTMKVENTEAKKESDVTNPFDD